VTIVQRIASDPAARESRGSRARCLLLTDRRRAQVAEELTGLTDGWAEVDAVRDLCYQGARKTQRKRHPAHLPCPHCCRRPQAPHGFVPPNPFCAIGGSPRETYLVTQLPLFDFAARIVDRNEDVLVQAPSHAPVRRSC
jgi:hypothetical protein